MTQKEKLLTAAILSVWMIYLLFQPGHPNDEAEHLHIAWLIQVHGLKPISDFFEHHQPAIWHLIGSLFRIGVNDDWLLFFGRIYVVVAALLSAIGLYLIGCRSTGVNAKSLLIPVFYFMLSSLFLKNLMVIRPETFATPCIIYCVLLWRASFSATQTNARLLSAGAGLLGIAAVMISPRFAILAPGIPLLFPSHLTVSMSQVIYRVTWGLLGSAVGFFLSLNFFNQSLADLTFNVEFSALLQTTGVGFYAGFPIILFVGVFSLLLFVIYLGNSQYSNSVKKVYLAIFIFIYLVSGQKRCIFQGGQKIDVRFLFEYVCIASLHQLRFLCVP